MFNAQSSLLDPLHLALPTRTSSLLFPSHGDIPCDPRPGAQFGRLAEQSSFAGYEPNDHIEVDNSEVTPMFFQRRTSIASPCNSGEDVAARLAQTVGMLASPLRAQESEASADPS